MTVQPFSRLFSVAAPLMEDNIDTDVIYPARFLLITARKGLGRYAFNDRRFRADGAEVPNFVLNRDPWRNAAILVTGANFGSGSSREQAVWALLGRGIRCVIAQSFGEIFQANCYRNGVLPIVLDASTIDAVAAAANDGAMFTIDLDAQTVTVNASQAIFFDISKERKLALLNGWDETALILNANGDDIMRFETAQRRRAPWLYEGESIRE